MKQNSPDTRAVEDIAKGTRADREATETRRHASDLYGRHAEALYSFALFLYQDAGQAEEALVTTLAWGAAARVGRPADTGAERRLLTSRLLLGHRRSTAGRSGHLDRPERRHASTIPLSLHEKTVLGLVMFGELTYRQAASLTGASAASVADRLRSLLHRANTFDEGRPVPPVRTATREGRQ
ncbi:hypothetical protein [Streptomyces montanisoli]|uniref:Uncharacterized protein n=1 Tax=Streptomyces montanisoli TaxID=2798581 RepID=A0A940MEY8_9ACTN|nr:hypothetical protein [Streptomyces montanisoli]MBP0460009.1 hypothetical protein [Streptomyces montanisoli]